MEGLLLLGLLDVAIAFYIVRKKQWNALIV